MENARKLLLKMLHPGGVTELNMAKHTDTAFFYIYHHNIFPGDLLRCYFSTDEHLGCVSLLVTHQVSVCVKQNISRHLKTTVILV